MLTPIDKSFRSPRLIVEVETSAGSGCFEADPRLRADRIDLGTDAVLSTAAISVRLDAHFDVGAAQRRYGPERRMVIRTDYLEPNRQEVLLEGYPMLQRAAWEGRASGSDVRLTLHVEGVMGRLARNPRSQIHGRRMRSGAIEDGLASGDPAYASQSVLVAALSCTFNPAGAPNCSPAPLTVVDRDGQTRRIHVFTYDGDPQAIRWTYLKALRYLFWFYAPSQGPLAPGNLFSATEAYADLLGDQPGYVSGSDPLAAGLLRSAESFSCEGDNLPSALAALVARTGVHITAETLTDNGKPRTRIKLWADGSGPVRWLKLARGGRFADGAKRFDAAAKTGEQVFDANNVRQAAIDWDYRRVVNAPIVIGGVKFYEMTVPLVPGWLPEANLDNVDPPFRAGAKSLALLPEEIEALGEDARNQTWFRRYHRQGDLFNLYNQVARLWALNEDGRYGAEYERNAPFDHYAPFDFSTAADATVARPGQWSRRVRPLRRPISVDAEGRPLEVFVEISFNSGMTWFPYAGPRRILSDRAGVSLDENNLTEITPPATPPETQNLWFALIDQTLRLRVSALFESDDRIIAAPTPEQVSRGALGAWSRVIYRPRDFAFHSRSHTTNVLAGVNPDADGVERDDSSAAAALAVQTARARQDRKLTAAPTIPWLETGYAIGDSIAGVAGQGISFATITGDGYRYPAVVGVSYVLGADRYETVLTLRPSEIE